MASNSRSQQKIAAQSNRSLPDELELSSSSLSELESLSDDESDDATSCGTTIGTGLGADFKCALKSSLNRRTSKHFEPIHSQSMEPVKAHRIINTTNHHNVLININKSVITKYSFPYNRKNAFRKYLCKSKWMTQDLFNSNNRTEMYDLWTS